MHNIKRLLAIMEKLRDPQGGCPWDLQQTYKTIVPHTLEEAYEVADTIEREQYDELRDELGDLLFQIVFYAQLAKEEQRFEFDDVVEAICDKLERRHPHVFGDVSYDDAEQQTAAWEALKKQERADRQPQQASSVLHGIAHTLPAISLAQKIQQRVARVGFDWPDWQGVIDKVAEETAEVRDAFHSMTSGIDDPAILADVLSQQFIHEPEERYELLSTESVAARIAWLCSRLAT